MRFMTTAQCLMLGLMLGSVAAGCSSSDRFQSKADVGTGTGVLLGGIAGSQFGRGSGRVVGAVVGAVAGGVIGNEIGRRLDQRDRQLAQEAEFDALERGESGRPRHWRNPDNGRYGEVIPQQPYQRAGRDCRDYVHTVFIEGRPETMRSTACRNSDGTWSALG